MTIDETVVFSHQRNQSVNIVAVDPLYKRQSASTAVFTMVYRELLQLDDYQNAV